MGAIALVATIRNSIRFKGHFSLDVLHMRNLIKRIVPRPVLELCRDHRDQRSIREYAVHQTAPPPEAYKRQVVKDHGRAYEARILIETGTFYGDMLHACRKSFLQIFSIELHEELASLARRRFRKQPHIHLFQGDSRQVLPEILAGIHEPAVFWLDGHYSGAGTAKSDRDTPIEEELAVIGRHHIKSHVILIDDARYFGKGDYPSSHALTRILDSYFPSSTVEIRDDILRCTPQAPDVRIRRMNDEPQVNGFSFYN